MKSGKKRNICFFCSLLCISMFCAFPVSAATISYSADDFALLDMLNALMPGTITILLILGPVVAVVMGVQYILAEDPQERGRAKKHIVDFCIGYLVVFILIAAVNILLPALVLYANDQIKTGLADGTLLS